MILLLPLLGLAVGVLAKFAVQKWPTCGAVMFFTLTVLAGMACLWGLPSNLALFLGGAAVATATLLAGVVHLRRDTDQRVPVRTTPPPTP